MKEASACIGYGTGRGGLEPVWTLWIREKFGHTGSGHTSSGHTSSILLALFNELSKAFINMEKLISHTWVRKEQRDF